ncbi:MAG: phosphatase PAP2 family protein [Nitrospinota bacterium]|nr:phosphatase PAP2 family protein [Nitrospinota bacterium]
MNSINEELFWIINRPLGTAVDNIMIAFTFSGYTLSALAIALSAMWLYGGLAKENLKFLVIAMIIGGVGVIAVKQVYVKDRPLGHFGEISKELQAKVHAPYKRPHHRTFPSGHSQTAFSVAAAMILLFRRHAIMWILWASLVAISRVQLGMHFPADILAGSMWGAFSAYLVYRYNYRKGIPSPS